MAAPTKLTEEKMDAIVDAIRAGNTNETAARLAGVGASTFYDWMSRGDGTHATRPKTKLHAEFAERVKRAEGEAEARAVALIQRASMTTWTAAAWWLERRRPQQWGQKAKLDLGTTESEMVIKLQWPDDKRKENVRLADESENGDQQPIE